MPKMPKGLHKVNVGSLCFAFVSAAKYNLNDERKHPKLELMNNSATIFIFFTVLINIFITALGFQGSTVRLGCQWMQTPKQRALFSLMTSAFFPSQPRIVDPPTNAKLHPPSRRPEQHRRSLDWSLFGPNLHPKHDWAMFQQQEA